MNKYLGLGMAAVLVLGVAVTALGGQPAVEKEPNGKTGVVKHVDIEGQTITVLVAEELTFTVTGDTRIILGSKAKKLADIKVGDTVTVEYTLQGKDNRMAVTITIAPRDTPATPSRGQ